MSKPQRTYNYYAFYYWELYWLLPLYRKLGGTLISGNRDTRELAKKLGFKISEKQDADVLIVAFMYTPEHNALLKATKSKRVILQHCWDNENNTLTDDWHGVDMHAFDLYCVAGEYDYKIMSEKFGADKIACTGMPRFDDLLTIQKSKGKPIFAELQIRDYNLVAAPSPGSHSNDLLMDYFFTLPKQMENLLFKVHPAKHTHLVSVVLNAYATEFPNVIFIGDKVEDPLWTYKLIKEAKSVVSPYSFMAIEAHMMGKDVIMRGDVLPETDQGTVGRRFSRAAEPDYLYDGKNTDRVIRAIGKL